MTEPSDNVNTDNENKKVIKEEINLQFHWYIFSFLLIYMGSFMLPGILFFSYIMFYFVPLFLDNPSIIAIFTSLDSFLALILMPLVILGCYILHLLLMGVITRILWRYTEKKSPTKDGNIPRNIPSKTLNYYHIRSFMIKYSKNCFTKGPFPWLSNWFYNFVGTNKIGKGTTIEEQVCADKYIDVGENCYIGVNSVLTSHFVEGIFGRITYFKIKVGDNTTLGGYNCIAPGTDIKDNCYLIPMAHAAKHYTVKGKNYYFGAPLHKIFKKKLMAYLHVSLDDLNYAKELEKQQLEKINSKNKSSEVSSND